MDVALLTCLSFGPRCRFFLLLPAAPAGKGACGPDAGALLAVLRAVLALPAGTGIADAGTAGEVSTAVDGAGARAGGRPHCRGGTNGASWRW